MKSFEMFTLVETDAIVGGELVPTYVTINGDFYDTERKFFVIRL